MNFEERGINRVSTFYHYLGMLNYKLCDLTLPLQSNKTVYFKEAINKTLEGFNGFYLKVFLDILAERRLKY